MKLQLWGKDLDNGKWTHKQGTGGVSKGTMANHTCKVAMNMFFLDAIKGTL